MINMNGFWALFFMKSPIFQKITIALLLTIFPVIIAINALHLWSWDFSVPLVYGNPGTDEIWQLVMTKTLLDTGWIFENPYLGAPGISHWYNNSSAQLSATHSFIMLFISIFVDDAIKVQQYYYILNFSLIPIATFVTCRAFSIAIIPSLLVGIMLAFTYFRVRFILFAYISNYFIVPLSLIPVVWTIQGKLVFNRHVEIDRNLSLSILSTPSFHRRFFVCALLMIVVAISDGYYAFFTLLLLSLALVLRAINSRSVNFREIGAPFMLILTLLLTVVVIMEPIRSYRAMHPEELSQDQIKQPSDAEIYSPSLKMLVAPIHDHRIRYLSDLGQWMVSTGNFNRKYPVVPGAPVVLGIFGTVLLAGSFFALAVNSLQSYSNSINRSAANEDRIGEPSIYMTTNVLALFVLICSITGGVGSLISLIFPSIRAYERFPIYILFLLYIGAASFVTPLIIRARSISKLCLIFFIVFLCILSFFDQIPKDIFGTSSKEYSSTLSKRFLAERSFVQNLESDLPANSLVYNYPYSQFVTNNKYYGWGAFGQIRLYLHSRSLRWSNGGAKGSPIEDWHERQSFLPLAQLVTEMRAVGFQAFVVDRLVLPQAEYETVRAEMLRITGKEPWEDDTARLSFWKIDPLPIRLEYARNYRNAEKLIVTHEIAAHRQTLPRIVNRVALAAALEGKTEYPVVLEKQFYPDLFKDGATLDRGFGQNKITPFSDIKGGVTCDGVGIATLSASDNISLSIVNRNDFDWQFNVGSFPMRIGIQVFQHGKLMPGERRVLTNAFVEQSGSVVVPYSLSEIFSDSNLKATGDIDIRFSLLQEGNAWFQSSINEQCRITVRR